MTGERFVFETMPGRLMLRVEYSIDPGGAVPAHRHPYQEQRIRVLSGELRRRVGDREIILHTGEECTIPPGVAHRQWHASAQRVDIVLELKPPLHFEVFAETICGLARDGQTNRKGEPNVLQAAVLFTELRDTMMPAGPGTWLASAFFRVLAPVGKLLGYRSRYSKYRELGCGPWPIIDKPSRRHLDQSVGSSPLCAIATARKMARPLFKVSSHSSCGTESATIPHPAWI